MVAFAAQTGAGGFSFDYTYFELNTDGRVPGGPSAAASQYAQWSGWRKILNVKSSRVESSRGKSESSRARCSGWAVRRGDVMIQRWEGGRSVQGRGGSRNRMRRRRDLLVLPPPPPPRSGAAGSLCGICAQARRSDSPASHRRPPLPLPRAGLAEESLKLNSDPKIPIMFHL